MKKRIGKIAAIILTIQIILQISTPILSEAITGTSDSRFEYSVNSDGASITITKYIGTDTEIVIPDKIDGYSVTSIGRYAFDSCRSLTNIEIPEGVTSIVSSAFAGCWSLSSIEIDEKNSKYKSDNGVLYTKDGIQLICYPAKKEGTEYTISEEVTSIESYAFSYCSNLTSIEIPKGVTSIGESAFAYCSNLTSIQIPEGVTSIENFAFEDCTSLISIEIPEGVTSIGYQAFYECSNLTSIEIPKGVTSIGNQAFKGCSSLTSIKVDEKNSKYKSDNGVLYTKDGIQLICYPAKKEGTEYTILEEVTSIENGAFYKCSNLTSIEIPKGVTSISDYAFYRCSNLISIEIPEGVTKIGFFAFGYCESLTNIEIPKGVISIGEWAFEGCSSLISIEIPEGVTKIGSRTFYGCSSLTSIEIPKGVTSISDYAFFNCDSLTSIEIPEGVTNIGGSAFSGCSSLASIEIPEGVTSIGGSAFSRCSSLTSIEIPEGVTSIGNSAFSDCSSLRNIEIPQGVRSIGDRVFSYCNNLTSIEIPEEVTSMGSNVFYGSNAKLTIKCKSGSTAHKYAIDNSRKYELDDIGPTLTVTYSTIDPTNKNVIATIIANEKVREIEGWTLSDDRLTLTKVYEINVAEDIEIKDMVGNSTATEIKITNIDKEAPILKASYNTTELTNGNVEVTITANEKVQGVSGWKLSTDGLSLIKTYTTNTTENIIVSDLAGNTSAVQVKIANIDKVAPTLTVEYNTANPTNQNVTATIKSNEKMKELTGWILSNDKKSLTKTYTTNTTENIIVSDLAGNTSTIQIKIANIDKTAPTLTVEYSTTNATNQNVTVTIKSNEEIQGVTGWTLSSDKKSISKTYTANKTETVTVKDAVGNTASATIKVGNIDKTAPKVEGVQNNKVYSSATLKVTDENLEKVLLTKNGQEITYTNEQKITTKGKYELTATDRAGNTTKVSFEIVEKAEITSESYTIDEENKYIIGIKAGELKTGFTSKIKSNIAYKILNKNDEEINETTKIGTGMKIKLETGETYEIVVKGDVNGDGKISTTDITKMKKHIIKKELLQGCYEIAGNINEDSKISVTDLAKMKKVLVGLITFN